MNKKLSFALPNLCVASCENAGLGNSSSLSENIQSSSELFSVERLMWRRADGRLFHTVDHAKRQIDVCI